MDTTQLKDANLNSLIRYKGFFDLDDILKFLKKWMNDRDYHYYERKYKKKPDLLGSKYDISIESDKRINAYVKWHLMVRIFVHDTEKRETIENGVKKTKQFGRLQLNFDAKLELDPDKRWETSKFKKLEKFFLKHVVNQDIDMAWLDDLYYEVYKIKEDFARYMNMYYLG